MSRLNERSKPIVEKAQAEITRMAHAMLETGGIKIDDVPGDARILLMVAEDEAGLIVGLMVSEIIDAVENPGDVPAWKQR